MEMLSCLWSDHYSLRTYPLDRRHPLACPRGNPLVRVGGSQTLPYEIRRGFRDMGEWKVQHQLLWEARSGWYLWRSTNCKGLGLAARQFWEWPTWPAKHNSEGDRERLRSNVHQWYAQADYQSQMRCCLIIFSSACGPHKMARSVRKAIRAPRPVDILRGGPTVTLHIESFGLVSVYIWNRNIWTGIDAR